MLIKVLYLEILEVTIAIPPSNLKKRSAQIVGLATHELLDLTNHKLLKIVKTKQDIWKCSSNKITEIFIFLKWCITMLTYTVVELKLENKK